MKKTVVLILIFVAFFVNMFGQSGELTYANGVWQHGTKLRPEQVREVYINDSEALQTYNQGRTLFILGQVVAYPCAFVFGYDLGTRLAGGDGNSGALVIGGIGTLTGILISFGGEAKIKNSLRIYNSKTLNDKVSYQVNFGLTDFGGIGLSLNF